MDKLIQLWTQHQTALAAGVVVVLVLVLLVARAGRRKLGKKIDPELAEENLSLDGHPPAPESNGPIVEGLPEVPPRAARTTPRTPRPVVGSGVGAYRLVRPSEPDVFTPPPSLRPSASEGRISGPVGKEALANVQRPAMEHRNATPTPRPALPLGTKPGLGAPAPRTSPKGTVLGIGPTRPGK